MSNIDATSISLIDFFTKEGEREYAKKYVSNKVEIPAFQRNYSWEIKHVKEFLDSVNENPKDYYIGNILVQKSPGSSSGDLIIDGQQRITTVFLILKTLTELRISQKKHKQIEEIFYSNMRQKIPRLNFSRRNLDHSFKKILEGDLSEENFTDENSKKFLKNFEYIKKYVLLIEDINNFFEKILNLTFVVITFKQGFDVNQLFEGLNSKGKILSPVQLTKNALLGSSKDEAYSDEIIKIWEEIETLYEKQNRIIWFDKFLRHLGFYKYGYVSSGELFKKIKNDIKTQKNILEFSNTLKKDSSLYFKLRTNKLLKEDIAEDISDSDWGTINAIIKNLSFADLDQVYSVLLAAIKFAQNDEKYRKGRDSRFLKDIRRIWAFSILVKYLDTKPSLFERDFAVFSNNLHKKSYIESRKLFIKLKEIIKDSNIEKFSSNINLRIEITAGGEKKVNSKNNRSFVSQLLFCYLQNGKNFIKEDCGIEHIIPIGKTNGLKNWINIGRKYKKNIEKKSRYKLGNLTLLSGKDELSNESFDYKLPFYIKNEYKKNKDIKKYKEKFNSVNPAEAVEERGSDIGNELYTILVNLLN